MSYTILQRIASAKRLEVEAMKRLMPLGQLIDMANETSHATISMTSSILSHEVAIIAEHKRRSPSKGEISAMTDVSRVAKDYFSNGAAAMSVLTDTAYFGGSLADLAIARMSTPDMPILRKDFIIDEYQIYQARLYGADAVLLIAAILDPRQLASLNDTAHKLGLQTLVEAHTPDEAKRMPSDADMAGVNNRNLASFTVDLDNASRLICALPDKCVKVAESGIHAPADLLKLKSAGFDAFLIGEAFMSTGNPGETLHKFITASHGQA